MTIWMLTEYTSQIPFDFSGQQVLQETVNLKQLSMKLVIMNYRHTGRRQWRDDIVDKWWHITLWNQFGYSSTTESSHSQYRTGWQRHEVGDQHINKTKHTNTNSYCYLYKAMSISNRLFLTYNIPQFSSVALKFTFQLCHLHHIISTLPMQ